MASILAACAVSRVIGPACTAINVCCTVASCFSCSRSPKVARFLYLLIFALSAAFAVILRYYGQQVLGSWVEIMKVCSTESTEEATGRCWGLQGAYRVSAALCGFFVTLIPLVLVYPKAHLAAWFLKFLWWVALLGVSFAIPNDFFTKYSEISRYLSILFLVAQVLIIIDFAYRMHERLLEKAEKKDRAMEAAGWEPGCLSNCWKVLYLFISFGGFGAAITAIGLMFKFLAPNGCGDSAQLMQFFLSSTLIFGLVLILLSSTGCVGKGLLTPVIIFMYCTYLCYGALTNNTDTGCNPFARQDNNNKTSIIIGVTIAVLSVSWASFSAARNFMNVVVSGATGKAEAAKARSDSDDEEHSEVTNVLAANPGIGLDDVEAGNTGQAKGGKGASTGLEVSASSYGSTGHESPIRSKSSSHAKHDDNKIDRRIWIFHLIMALGGLYLAMVTTNWGDESKIAEVSSNPELSVASMWVRMVTQWLVYILFCWSLIASICCKGRDFS